jgi:hypothetical protein
MSTSDRGASVSVCLVDKCVYSVLISVAPLFIFVLSWICYCAG